MKASKKKVTLKQRAKKAGIPAQLVYNRMHDGWSEKKALSVPVRKRAKSKKVKKVEPRVIMEPKDDQLWGTEARKKKVAYKVEPSEVQRSGSRVKPIPMEGIQKFEAPKRSNWQIYVVVALVGVLALAMILR
jgi:hypothetical protein